MEFGVNQCINYGLFYEITLKNVVFHAFRDVQVIKHKNGRHHNVQLDETYKVAILVRRVWASLDQLSH